MGRSSSDFIVPYNAESFRPVIEDFLFSEGYKAKNKDGELVYQKGSGLMMGPTFIRFLANGNYARVEVWMKYAVLPGVYVGELDNSSIVGSAVKGPLKKRVNYIESLIMQGGGQLIGRDMPANLNIFPPAYMQQMYQQPVYQQPPIQQMYQPSAPQGTVACANCGSANPGGSVFCSSCGSKF